MSDESTSVTGSADGRHVESVKQISYSVNPSNPDRFSLGDI